jgi:hypothetical protein
MAILKPTAEDLVAGYSMYKYTSASFLPHNVNITLVAHIFFMCIAIYKQDEKNKNIFKISSRY